MKPMEAQAAYRAAWLKYRETLDDYDRRELERVMDNLQELICSRYCPLLWDEFIASLPGYLEFWQSRAYQDEMKQRLPCFG